MEAALTASVRFVNPAVGVSLSAESYGSLISLKENQSIELADLCISFSRCPEPSCIGIGGARVQHQMPDGEESETCRFGGNREHWRDGP